MNFLTGYKTYITAGITLILIVLHLFGFTIPGVDYTALGSIGATIAVLFARHGAATDAAKAVVIANSADPIRTVSTAKTAISETK